ncbi:hypothetical protein RB195_014458 [Necator americanus]|uniref:RRM domain-containing protein n=1 Tax=Necator americanus TaxID=51031 RepID=A0ABR1E059_NECAM
MNNPFDRRERTVFVSMIDKSITDDGLYELMKQVGPVEKIIFKENPDGTLMHALVIFRNVESVVLSMIHLQPMIRNSKLIQIRPLRESSHRFSSCARFSPMCGPLSPQEETRQTGLPDDGTDASWKVHPTEVGQVLLDHRLTNHTDSPIPTSTASLPSSARRFSSQSTYPNTEFNHRHLCSVAPSSTYSSYSLARRLPCSHKSNCSRICCAEM